MNTPAQTKEMAIEVLQALEPVHGKVYKYHNITTDCDCGETNAVCAEYVDFHRATVGYCENCGTDWRDEIQGINLK